jgi:hypothetical protein
MLEVLLVKEFRAADTLLTDNDYCIKLDAGIKENISLNEKSKMSIIYKNRC